MKQAALTVYQAVGWFLVAAVLVAGGCKLAQAAPYPRIVSYHGGSSTGAPFVNGDGTLNDVLIRQAARYPMITVNPNACATRPDFVQRLRFWNPAIKILFYDQHSNWHLDSTFVVNASDTSFYAEKHRALQWAHAWTPAPPNSGFAIDWKQQDGADTLTRLYVKHTKRFRPDGWFFDYFSPVAFNVYSITEDDAYNRLYHTRRLVTALREALPGILVFGNGAAYGADRAGLDGQMNEGFYGSLTPFTTAIKQKEGDWLKSESAVGTSGNAQLARYTLGTACLTGAYSNHGNSHYYGAPEEGTWWFKEYSVDPAGNEDPTGRYTSWLGEAVGPPQKMTSTCWIRKFQNGAVVVGGCANVPLGGNYKAINSATVVTVGSCPSLDATFYVKTP